MTSIVVDLVDLSTLRVNGIRPGADITLMPELADGGYASLKEGKGTYKVDDPFFEAFRRMSLEQQTLLVPGSARVENGDGSHTNSVFAFSRGVPVLRYDKKRLFAFTGEDRLFRAGDKVGTFVADIRGHSLRIGVLICFDLRFPEIARELLKQGAEVILVPARWPSVRSDAWKTLLRARAIENQVFVVGCNAQGPEGGPSFVFDPLGREVQAAESGDEGRWKRFTLDMGLLDKARILYDARRYV